MTAYPGNPEIIFFGGEYYNGSKTQMFRKSFHSFLVPTNRLTDFIRDITFAYKLVPKVQCSGSG